MKKNLTYLMVALSCFQFQNGTLSSFSGWCALADESHMQFQNSRVIQQFLQVAFPVELIVNSDLTAFELKILKGNIFTSFSVHCNRVAEHNQNVFHRFLSCF